MACCSTASFLLCASVFTAPEQLLGGNVFNCGFGINLYKYIQIDAIDLSSQLGMV